MRLATFNVLHGRSLTDGQVRLERLAAAVRTLDADVLALQEVDRDQPRSHGADLTAVAAEAMQAVDYRFVPALIGTPGGRWKPADGHEHPGEAAYGISLLSRLPVESWRVIHLPPAPVRVPLPVLGPRGPQLVPDEPRVAVAATVSTPEGRLVVVTTHLTYVPGWNLRQLRRLRGELRASQDPFVLLGDLNMGPQMARAATGLQPLAHAKTFPAHAPRRQLDHVLARGVSPVATGEALSLPLSDHRALQVDVVLSGRRSGGGSQP